ncbi:MAG: HD domain-containing phosphohydrolase [Bdellovibrio sp.]
MSHVPIRVSTLRGDQRIGFDVYIKINDGFLLYLKKGDSFEGHRLNRLRRKKLKKMFILADEEKSYRDYVILNVEMAYDEKSDRPLETRSQIVQGYQQSQAESLLEIPSDQKLYEEAKKESLKFAEFLKSEPKALNFIMKMENNDENIAHHGVSVSALACALAHRLGTLDQKQMQFLSFGALLHDIEHAYTGFHVARNLSVMPPEELVMYKNHPVQGAHRVGQLKHFEKTVLNIIAEHEEFVDGRGFPQGLKESQLDPLSIIVGSANVVDRKISFEKIPAQELTKNLMMTCLGQRPLDHLKILTDLISLKA